MYLLEVVVAARQDADGTPGGQSPLQTLSGTPSIAEAFSALTRAFVPLPLCARRGVLRGDRSSASTTFTENFLLDRPQ